METPFEKPPIEEAPGKQDIGALTKILTPEGQVELKRSPNEHVHKNDEEYGYIIGQIHDSDIKSDKLRVGLIVGNGAILSSLPDVPADVVIMSDYNPFIHEWTLFTAHALEQSESIGDFRRRVYSEENPLYSELLKQGVKPDEGLQREIKDLGQKHFLSSEKRFQECKEAVRKKQLLMAAVDLRDQTYLTKLAYSMKEQNAEVTFANLTNVWEHAGNGLADALPRLPFHSQAVILHSSRAYTDRFYPKMMGICKGVGAYIENAKSAYSFWSYKNLQRGRS